MNVGPDQVLAAGRQWQQDGRGVALATVIATWGSSPRQAGSQLVVNDGGEMIGSVSGGCVEGEVVRAAKGVIEEGGVRRLEFGVADELAWEVGLACGGTIHILVQPLPRLDPLLADLATRTPVVRLVALDNGDERLVYPMTSPRPADLDVQLWQSCQAALERGRSEVSAAGDVFVHAFPAPVQLFVIGAGHIAQKLAALARNLDWAVTIIDPRGAFCTRARFPDPQVRLSDAWPGEALGEVELDSRSALVTCSHDPKVDDPGLVAALDSGVFYIGALGSRRTHAARLLRLRAAGFTDEALQRIHAPVGLDIGARTPAEIGVAVVAEVVARLRDK